jgi:hypothetical protein
MTLSKKYLTIISSLFSLILLLILCLPVVYAQNCPDPNNCNCPGTTCPDASTGGSSLDNPLGKDTVTPIQIYGRIIFSFMGATGSVALVMFVWGGFVWMTAAGNETKIKKGKETLLWAVLGLFVIFSSYAILRAVFQTLQFAGS